MNTRRVERTLYKLRRVYLPTIGLNAALSLIYSALHWYLISSPGHELIREDILEIWLPMILSAAFAIFVVRPRLRSLRLGPSNKWRERYVVAATILLAAPCLVAQLYVDAAAGTMVHVRNATDIASDNVAARYYTADRLCFVRAGAAATPHVAVNGRYNQDITFSVYVVAPVCADATADAQHWPLWIGFRYSETISNRLPDSTKEAAYRKFLADAQSKFDAEKPERYRYLQRLGQTSDKRYYVDALHRTGNASPAPIILIPHTDEFSHRAGTRLQWALALWVLGALVWLPMVLIPGVDNSARRKQRDTRTKENVREMARLFLIPTRQFYGLPLLLDVNIGVYLAMALSGLGVVSFETADLIRWGANYGPDLHGLGLFRLISSQFVHAGLFHIAGNMYGLLFAGFLLLPVTRNVGLIFAYLLCGFGGSVATAVVNPLIPSVGASGAIFGLFGILLAIATLGDRRVADRRDVILINGGIFAGINLLFGAAVPGIDNAAHIGGLLTGLVLGLAIFAYGRYRPAATQVDAPLG